MGEYCRNTGRMRKYVITKIHKAELRPKQREETYEGQVQSSLGQDMEVAIGIEEIFVEPIDSFTNPGYNRLRFAKRLVMPH